MNEKSLVHGNGGDGLLFKGDCLPILKKLHRRYRGRIQCIYIDPPYNAGVSLPHYDDGVPHRRWLSGMHDRLRALRSLLSPEGSIWIALDDCEMAYCKILCDGIFGRANFISTVIWEWRQSQRKMRTFESDHEYVLVYAKDKSLWKSKVGPFQSVWSPADVGGTFEARHESEKIFGPNAFSTPKPERLIKKVLEIATKPGDIVLDAFAGSGTTGAVAQKMGRKWIMIEKGKHCETHVLARMKKVVSGQDAGGVSQELNWKGGGGFQFMRSNR